MRILITAGGTREYIDPVRFISNASSGRMGYELARAALRKGHHVTLISAPTALTSPKGAQFISAVTSDEMFSAVKAEFDTCDVLIMAAAVSDYKPAKTLPIKIKKQQTEFTLKLKPTRDILAWAGQHKRNQFVVGFALEDKDVLIRAREKMTRKNADMIIANTPDAIGAADSSVWITTQDTDWFELTARSKTRIAGAIIRNLERYTADQ
jgi:phosphopantothenoylcysteine decarboxylase/phosphopantothenate--cysteine ligase